MKEAAYARICIFYCACPHAVSGLGGHRALVAALAKGGVPQRTTLMKLSKVSTLWDYVNRAMPWNAPKTLSTDEVYAVVAYILNLGAVVPEDFTLSDKNIAEVQEKLPNRNGLKRLDGMWETKGKPDTANVACMKNCAADPVIGSFLPDFARNAHGNLAEQNRLIGAARGADTTRPAPAVLEGGAAAARAAPPAALPDVKQLLAKNSCSACHGVSNKIIGPAFRDVAARYKDKAEAASYLLAKMKNGGAGVWGAMAMPPQGQLNDADAKVIAHWLVAGAN
jgi:cytochrome c